MITCNEHPRLHARRKPRPSLANLDDQGKIVLPCKPRYPLKGKSFFLARFVADLTFAPGIRWMQTLRTAELY